MNNCEWDQAKGELGSESIGCYQSTDYSAMKEVKSEATGRQRQDLYTLRKQQSNANNKSHKNNSVTAAVGHNAQ